MRVLISGGGTGGHIYPAVTIARTIERLVAPSEILFVGTKQGLEADIIPKEGFAFTAVEASGFERRLTLGHIATIAKTMRGIGQAISVIRHFRPNVVIGTGGYVSGPVLFVAALMGIPALIHESDVIPGLTNKILARFVGKVTVGYAEAAPYFGARADKVIATGNPVRPEVLSATRGSGLAEMGLKDGITTLLVAGGSRGARSINRAMVEVYRRFGGSPDIQILHITGQNEYNNLVGLMTDSGIDYTKLGNVSIRPYLYNMPQALAVADIAVFRAGAIGLAELTARGIPSILIPYPYAAANHQEFNARVLEGKGAALVILDADLTGERLADAVSRLLKQPETLAQMAAASRELGHPEAAEQIAATAIALARSGSDLK